MKSYIPFIALIAAIALASPASAADPARPTLLAQAVPEVCTDNYLPVCGTDPSGKRVTYSNACFARAAKATAVTPGACSK